MHARIKKFVKFYQNYMIDRETDKMSKEKTLKRQKYLITKTSKRQSVERQNI